ncbi:MAG: LLM class flavin-dependent oxidoreductase [Anaerolineaceae bacterium]|nr:LLM class flavin-dependent oxidoreductase [Anaerolineaceae bacterium]
MGALTQKIHLGNAIMQMPARTPANTAMIAMTLDQLSWRALPVGLLACRWLKAGTGTAPRWGNLRVHRNRGRFHGSATEHDGAHQIPYRAADATGLGKPLKSILHGRPDILIYLAAIGPKNVALAAEIADGWSLISFPRALRQRL